MQDIKQSLGRIVDFDCMTGEMEMVLSEWNTWNYYNGFGNVRSIILHFERYDNVLDNIINYLFSWYP